MTTDEMSWLTERALGSSEEEDGSCAERANGQWESYSAESEVR